MLAALWGALVGAEREYRSKSAGFRTMTMISIGACFFTIMSESIGTPGNPDRIASNIVTGIGFLGAGVIFRGENRVNGITTAATIWAVAAVGMGIGAGYYIAAACASVLILVVLAVLPYVESQIDKWNQSKTYIVKCAYSPSVIDDIEKLLRDAHLQYNLFGQIREDQQLTLKWNAQGSAVNHQRFISNARNDDRICYFEY